MIDKLDISKDPVALTQALIQCPSVTPKEAGALTLLENLLSESGFKCTRVDRGDTSNLFARWGRSDSKKIFGFNGHTDVVPVGALDDWEYDPFAATIHQGKLYGRGACDMKSGVAAFATAAIDFVTNSSPDGAIVITITGDEEGDAKDGTVAILDWMEAHGERMDFCLVGEPTCPTKMGEMIKIGRRGSMTIQFKVTGIQGHVAYPHRANNPIPALVRLLDELTSTPLDAGTKTFEPSMLAITTIDTGNVATNVIPSEINATVNIRFNDAHSSDSLSIRLTEHAAKIAKEFGVDIALDISVSGESFVTQPGEYSKLISKAVSEVTGIMPELSTSGGTSDARFIKNHCPVVECGLVGSSMHQVDEHVEVTEIIQLKDIYKKILVDYFAE